MIFSKRTISDLLINSVQMINNALSNAEIKEALLAYNFTEELIREGLKIHEETNNLAEDFTTYYGKKLEAEVKMVKDSSITGKNEKREKRLNK